MQKPLPILEQILETQYQFSWTINKSNIIKYIFNLTYLRLRNIIFRLSPNFKFRKLSLENNFLNKQNFNFEKEHLVTYKPDGIQYTVEILHKAWKATEHHKNYPIIVYKVYKVSEYERKHDCADFDRTN